MRDAIARFPFLANKIIHGEILAANVENKATMIRKPFKCKVGKTQKTNLGLER